MSRRKARAPPPPELVAVVAGLVLHRIVEGECLAHLPGAGLVYYGNAANPNYTGGEARYFDTRLIPNSEKFSFVLEKIVEDSLVTARIRWASASSPGSYAIPELPFGTHRGANCPAVDRSDRIRSFPRNFDRS